MAFYTVDNARRGAYPTNQPNIARDYIAVAGGFLKQDVPPSDWNRPEAPEKRQLNSLLAKREAPPEVVTSTKWITTDNCAPTSTASGWNSHESHDHDEDEECDEDQGSASDYTIVYDATSSGKLAQATSSPSPAGAPYTYQPASSSGAPHVGMSAMDPAQIRADMKVTGQGHQVLLLMRQRGENRGSHRDDFLLSLLHWTFQRQFCKMYT